jgi:hypothetical protein
MIKTCPMNQENAGTPNRKCQNGKARCFGTERRHIPFADQAKREDWIMENPD